jgi:hypothetical protein
MISKLRTEPKAAEGGVATARTLGHGSCRRENGRRQIRCSRPRVKHDKLFHNMRVTISHNRTKQEIIASVDRSFDELFQGASGLPVKVMVNQRSWQGDVLTFALTAKLGLISTPIKGTVEVTDKDLTVDADLGMLNNFISDKAATEMVGTRLKGLLNK